MVSRLRSGAEGFALVETLVSAVLLVVMAVAILPVLDLSISRSGTQRSRGVANALVKAETDRLRGLDVTATLSGLDISTPRTVDGVVYTIKSKANWVLDGSGTQGCTSQSTNVDYLRLRVTATWPEMNGVKPITSDVLVAPPVTALAGTGTIAMVLTRADGSPAVGVPVSANSTTVATNDAGCAVFGGVPTGSAVVTYSLGGWVSPDGLQAVSTPVTVAANDTAVLNQSYDQAGSVTATFDTAMPTARASAAFGLTAAFQTLSTNRLTPQAAPTALTTPSSSLTLTGLYPFTTPYSLYAGRCKGNNPALYAPGGTSSARSVLVGRGATVPAQVLRVPGVKVLVTTAANAAANAAAVKVVADTSDANMVGCTETYSALTDTTGTAVLPVPFGKWRVCASSGTSLARPTTDPTPVDVAEGKVVSLKLGTATGSC